MGVALGDCIGVALRESTELGESPLGVKESTLPELGSREST